MQEIKKNEQFEKIKIKFEELQKNIEDLICKEHSKTKTIYVDKLPTNQNEGGFICEYCPNPTNNLKFYSHIIEENAQLINKFNKGDFSEKRNNLNENEIKHFSELFFQLDERNVEFNKELKSFDLNFLPNLFTKQYGDKELMKLNEIMKTISFNKNGKPIYENIGQNKDREIQYVKLAHILLFLKDYKFTFESNLSQGLYNHIEQIIAERDQFNSKTNEYMKFITGEFYQKIHEIDNIPVNENFLKNKKLFIDVKDSYLIEFNEKLKAKEEEINLLNEKLKNLNLENERNRNSIENLIRKNNETLGENRKQENLIKELQEKLNDTCVQSANSQEEIESKLLGLNSEFEKKMKKLQQENEQKIWDKDIKINDLLEQINKLKEYIESLEKEKRDFHEKTLNLNSEISILKNQNQKKLMELNNQNLLTKKDYEEKIYSLNKKIEDLNSEKIKLEKDIRGNQLQIEELLLSRKNLGDTYTDEKNDWFKIKNNLLLEIEKLKLLNQNSSKLEILNKDLNKKIDTNAIQIEYLNKKNEELEKIIKNLNFEKEELQRRIENYIIENNSLTSRIKSIRGENNNSEFNIGINNELLNDLKKQVVINKTLNAEIENMQEKINSYNNKLSSNELLIKNQLDLIKKYHEEKPILSYERKDDLINSNLKQTQNIIDKIEKIENDPLKRSLNVPINDDNLESYIRNTITNSNPSENLNKSLFLISENPEITGIKNNLQAFRPTKILYKINFSNELLLNNSNWEIVRNWIEETNVFSTGIQPKLLFKATKDGFRTENFQEKCLNIQNLLILAKTDRDKVIGGFSPLPWMIPEMPERYFKDLTNSTFIFSINEKEKYLIKKNEYAICVTKNQGPIFGSKDLEIKDNCNSQYTTVNNFGNSFNTKKSGKDIFGSEKYLINDYEVYQII